MDNSNFPVKPHIRFTEHEEDPGKDSYGPYDPNKLFLNPTWRGHTAGTEYEEWRCLLKEYNLFSQLNGIDNHDWSYDPPNINNHNLRYQGKQW